MYPNGSARLRGADAFLHHALDMSVNGGPLAGRVRAAEERQQAAQSWATVWAATHATRRRTPGAWRRWLGAILVRAGGRLQGAPAASLAPDPTAVADAAGAAD